MPHLATIAHLTDFHFIKNLTEEDRRFVLLRLLGAKPHSFARIDALSLIYKTIDKFHDKKIDLNLFTGDLTTDGRKDSFETFNRYISSAEIKDHETGRLIVKGLGTSPHNRILIPGNHDRYKRRIFMRQSRSKVFEQEMYLDADNNGFPYVVGYKKRVGRTDASHPAILFFVFDSTLPTFVGSSFSHSFARGYVGREEWSRIETAVNNIKSTGKVKSFDGALINVDFERCVRVGVLHHDPFEAKDNLLMQNNEFFRDKCQEHKIDLVVYGHTHKSDFRTQPPENDFQVVQSPKSQNKHITYYLCAASATEGDSNNGFYIYDVSEDGFSMHEYEYQNKSAFVKKRPASRHRFSR
ncbi:UNVERIFIED_ORG: 3',5'-cyclic AMP phosphodiesterase CpdA [Methylorubrum zatmanii]